MDINTIAALIGGVIVTIILGLQNRSTNKKIKTVNETADNLNARIKDLEKDLKASNSERDKANVRVGEISVRVSDLETHVTNLKELNAQKDIEKIALATERDDEIRRSGKLAEELANERQITAELERRIRALEDRSSDLEKQLAVAIEINHVLPKEVNQSIEQMASAIVEKISTALIPLVKPEIEKGTMTP